MPATPKLKDVHLQALCDIVGDTCTGLTGSEIGRYLDSCSIPDPDPSITKRHRLFQALRAKQEVDRCANGVLAFVEHVMDPVSYVGRTSEFEIRRSALNAVLAFSGIVLGEDGQLRRTTVARTVSEAEAAASTLRKALVQRQVHGDVLKFCRAELVVENYLGAALLRRRLFRLFIGVFARGRSLFGSFCAGTAPRTAPTRLFRAASPA